MPTNCPQVPALLYPADVAKVLGKSEWWVKEQARRGRIPFTKLGRGYRFTVQHVAEIVRIYESWPTMVAVLPPTRPAPARSAKPVSTPTVRLHARAPRRVARPLNPQPDAT